MSELPTSYLQNPSNKGKWYCSGCNTWNGTQGRQAERCSFCSKPRPKAKAKPVQSSTVGPFTPISNKGLTLETAIPVNPEIGIALQVNKYLGQLFGTEDDDYFIHNEQRLENKQTGLVYHVVSASGADNKRKVIYFVL